MMANSETPSWLHEVQNKSWEPEILISGITLTFLFVLSGQIYNFYAMLIQDVGIYEAIGRNLYRVSLILLTGFKLIIIVHLILRGLWTGLVGLSYTFPAGIRLEKMGNQRHAMDPVKPVTLVVQLEKVCSLLFSFIFTSIIFGLGFFIIFVPVSFLFLIGLDAGIIRAITLFVILPLVMLGGIALTLFSKRLAHSAVNRKINNMLINRMLMIYYTNVGFLKTNLIFIVYFSLIILMVYPDLSRFRFRNESVAQIAAAGALTEINFDNYEDTRNTKMRIPKATLKRFALQQHHADLFVSFYKEDLYTVKLLSEHPEAAPRPVLHDSTGLNVTDLLRIYIDGRPLNGLEWYGVRKGGTNQRGFVSTLPLDSLDTGLHRLTIDKVYWEAGDSEPKLLEGWGHIPFKIAHD